MSSWSRDFRETLRRAGFLEDCAACRGAVAQGREACAGHYVPVEDREQFQEQREEARHWFRPHEIAERRRRRRQNGTVLRLEPDDG